MSKAKQKTVANPIKTAPTKAKAKQSGATMPASVAPISKQATLITLLKRPKGATLDELMEATGWQRHSVHGTLSGVLKKRLGYTVVTEFGDRGRTYRIADAR